MLYRYLLLFLLPFLVSSLTAYFDLHILHLGDSIHSKKSLLLPLQKAFFLLLTFYLVNSFSTFKIQFECHFLSPQNLSKDHLPPDFLEYCARHWFLSYLILEALTGKVTALLNTQGLAENKGQPCGSLQHQRVQYSRQTSVGTPEQKQANHFSWGITHTSPEETYLQKRFERTPESLARWIGDLSLYKNNL